MFKARICGWIGLLPLFMLSLPVQAELRCVANTVDIEPFFSAATAEDKQSDHQQSYQPDRLAVIFSYASADPA